MTATVKDDRWFVTDKDFATRIIVPDLQGFFARLPVLGAIPKQKTLVIEPGTLAAIVENGFLVGQLAAGTYTLESFLERLQFWNKKQATVFLSRAEEVPLETELRDVPTLEGFPIDVDFRWTIQVRDVMQLVDNLMGARDSLSIADLSGLLTPIVDQAIKTTIGQIPFDETRKPDLVGRLLNGLRLYADTTLDRYGINLVDVQLVATRSEADGLRDRESATWLKNREIGIQRAADAIEDEATRQRADAIRSRISVQGQLREAIHDDKLADLQTKEDLEKAILEIDKQRVLRREEIDELKESYYQNKEDRQAARNQLLVTVDMLREQEISELQIEIDHAAELKSFATRDEILRLSQNRGIDEQRHTIELERTAASHRREQKLESVRQQLTRAREVQRQSRDESYENILHQQRIDQVQGDLEYAQAKRRNELTLSEEQLNSRLAEERLAVQKRQQEWELEFKDKKSTNQIERLRHVQQMNADFSERQLRLQFELEAKKEDGTAKRELDRIAVLGGLSVEAMIALAGTNNAALLADLKKHQATQEAVKVTGGADSAAALNEERLRMYERMNEIERAKADAIAEAYKVAMQSQQGNVNQMIGGLAQAATSQSRTTPGTQGFTAPPAPPAHAPPPMAGTETWYISIGGKQSAPLNFEQVRQYAVSGQATLVTMVWTEGMKEWKAAGEVAALSSLFAHAQSSLPPGPPPL